jgi:hypothetical protein
MVYRAKSNNVKRLRARKKHDAIMQKAIDAYRKGKQEARTRTGLRAIAAEHGVSYVTLSRQVKGGRSISEFNASKQKISKVEENVLVQFIKESADRGFPMSHKTIAFHANAILQSHLGDGYEPVGESWIFRFLDRHEDELQTHWSKPLDMQRARALNPEVVDAWFDLVKRWIINQGIQKEDIYGMDESGFPPSGQGTERVVGGRGVKTQHKQGGADRENVTALVTICADGTALRPTIIFKGKNFMKKWGKDNIANAS